MSKDKDDLAFLLVAVVDLLRSWRGQCQYNVKKETTQQQNERESLNLKDKDVKPTYCYFIKQRNFVKIGNSRDPLRRG